MIRVENLVKEFPSENSILNAIDNVSFHVNKGEVFGIIGLSGAGKSTLVRCLNRLEEPTSGQIIIDGININDLSKKELLKVRKNMGMIFQSFNLFNQKNVYENIAYPLEILGIKKKEIKEKVDELLDFVDLKDKKYAYPREISGGQKQRVAIARALATKPKILLSDEATSALDPANTDQILNLLKASVEKYKMTIIMITHQMEVAKNICDTIAVMENGKIVERGSVEEIFKSPKAEITKSFIKDLPDEVEKIALNPNEFSGSLYRLGFGPKTVKEPILNRLMREAKCDVNILSGNITSLSSGTSSGYLNIEFLGEENEIKEAVEYLEKSNVLVEEIYGKNN